MFGTGRIECSKVIRGFWGVGGGLGLGDARACMRDSESIQSSSRQQMFKLKNITVTKHGKANNDGMGTFHQ